MFHDPFLALLASHHHAVYIALFLLLFIEGDALLFMAVFLAQRRVLSLGVVLPLVLAGTVSSDIVWYLVGRYIERQVPRLHAWIHKAVGRWDHHITGKLFRTLAIAKFTYGVYRPIVMRVGAMKTSFWKFLWAVVRAALIWEATIGAAGYLSSAGIRWLGRSLRYGGIALAVAVVVFIFIEWSASRRMSDKI